MLGMKQSYNVYKSSRSVKILELRDSIYVVYNEEAELEHQLVTPILNSRSTFCIQSNSMSAV